MNTGSRQKIREGESPAEPRNDKTLIQKGPAGASPSLRVRWYRVHSGTRRTSAVNLR